jgi:hypothetical protein
MPRFVASSLLGVSVGLLAGCPDRSISEVTPLQGRVEAKDIPVVINRDLDLLFVIDDSPSMADKQANLIKNFPEFMKVLSSIPGGLPNVHIGVVTSDLGTQGAGDSNPSFGPGIGQLGMGGCSGTGKDGNLQLFTAAGAVGGDLFISDIADPVSGIRTRNYMPATEARLEEIFGQMASAGAGGCGFEQHLEAMRHALQPSNAVNQRFLRKGDPVTHEGEAYLGVIIIADEDDCSLQHYSMLGPENTTLGPQQSFRCTRFGVTCNQNGQTSSAMNQIGPKGQCHPSDDSPYLTKVNDYVTFLKGLKSSPRKVIVAGIVGDPDPVATELRAPPRSPPGTTPIPALAHSCTYNGADGTEVADPAIRIKFFLDQFPNRSTFSTICQRDLSGGLQQIGDLLKTVIGDPCIEGKLADVDPKTAGPQYECSVSYVKNPDDPVAQETLLPKCTPESGAATNLPCWHLASDPVNCPTTPTQLTLKIEGQDMLKVLGTDVHVLANCVTEAQ